jgi:hypothetical protein
VVSSTHREHPRVRVNANQLAYSELAGTSVVGHILRSSLPTLICLVWYGFLSCPTLSRPLATHLLTANGKALVRQRTPLSQTMEGQADRSVDPTRIVRMLSQRLLFIELGLCYWSVGQL